MLVALFTRENVEWGVDDPSKVDDMCVEVCLIWSFHGVMMLTGRVESPFDAGRVLFLLM